MAAFFRYIIYLCQLLKYIDLVLSYLNQANTPIFRSVTQSFLPITVLDLKLGCASLTALPILLKIAISDGQS